MAYPGIASLLLIILNIAFSYKGFNNRQFFEGYQFEVDKILVNKDYKRLVTSGFLHIGWTHLLFNLLSLYFFSGIIETYLGVVPYLVIYFASLVGGDLFSLLVHRHHGDYSSVGASGAVCGIIFASIALFPGMSISFFFIPMQAWLYGILYVLFTIYAIRSKKYNIGHDAHLGGALIGMAVALIFQPRALAENTFTILVVAIPAIVFILIIIKQPQTLLVDNLFFQTHADHYSIDHQYNAERNRRQKEVDRILDKISRHGIQSLSKKELARLNEHAKKLQ